MPQVKRFDPTIGSQPRVQTGAQEQMLGSLADRLRGFATRENKLADIEAQKEGERAGEAAAAGRVGGVDIPEDMTIRDQAFATGARVAHTAAIQTDIRKTVADLELNNQNDIGNFNLEFDAYKEGLLSEVDDSLKPMAIKEMGDYSLRSKVRIEKTMFDTAQTEQLAAINTASDGFKDDAMSSAYNGDNALYDSKREDYFDLLDSGVESGLLDKNKVEITKRAFEDEALMRTVTGAFDRTIDEEGLDQAEESYKKFRSKKHQGVDPDLVDKIDNKMKAALTQERARVRSEITRGKAVITAREKALDRTVKNAEYSLDHGRQVEGLPELIEVSRGTKHEATLKSIQIHQDAVNEFVQLSPAQMDETLNKQNQKKLSGEQVRLVERLEKTRDYTRGELKSGRGLDLALEQNIIEDLPPLGEEGAFQERARLSKVAEEHYGQPISPMTDSEIDDFKAGLDEMSSDEKIVAMGQLAEGLGTESLPLLENLAGKNSGTYAVAGSLMVEGRGNLGREMIKGLDARAAYPKIIPKDFDTQFNNIIKTAYARTPKQVEVLRDSMRNIYAQRAANNGNVDGVAVDTEVLTGAFNEVTGGVYSLEDQGSGFFMDNAYDIEAPQPGVDQDQFIDWMENITQAEVEDMGAGSIAPELSKAINDMSVKLITLGDGNYQVIRNGLPVVNDDLTPFTLTWPK